MSLLHATCVVIEGRGLLITGPSGSGKSDLALRLMGRGAELVSDDQVQIEERNGALFATAPTAIAGMMEVRGVGLTNWPVETDVMVRLIVELAAAEQVPRLPEPEVWRHGNVTLPSYRLNPFEVSAADKVLLLVRAVDGDILRA
jgi:serine kinase of HPr protein (carbohydrate metabolism regulator)